MNKLASVALCAFLIASPVWAQTSNDAITSSSGGGSGTVTSVATGCGATGGPITSTGTISAAMTSRTNATSTDTLTTSDCGNVAYENSSSAIAVSWASTFAAGQFYMICSINTGVVTITPPSGTIGGASNYALPANGTAANPACYGFKSDGTNYQPYQIPFSSLPIASITGLGTGVAAALADNVGSAGAPVVNGGALGTPSSGVGTNLTGTAPGLTAGNASAAPLSGITGLGTGNATLLGNATGSAGGPTQTIASGTAALGTGAISSASCATVVTATATNAATTDVVLASFNGDPTAVTGYSPVTTGALTLFAYPTANTFNVKVCNLTSASITPGAITLNWRVVR